MERISGSNISRIYYSKSIFESFPFPRFSFSSRTGNLLGNAILRELLGAPQNGLEQIRNFGNGLVLEIYFRLDK